MILYLINMTLCALLLYAVYCLFLENESMHCFKRFYLLAGLVFSLAVPLIPVTGFVRPQPENGIMIYVESTEKPNENTPISDVNVAVPANIAITKSFLNYSPIIFFIYGVVALFFLFRLIKNSLQIAASGKNKETIEYQKAKIILTEENRVPHSFGKYIFLNKEKYNKGLIDEEIIIHEWTHVKQKHSLDILFLELLIAFFWFNPVFYLYRNKIKLNHEFLADENVIKRKGNIFGYQTVLIDSIRQTTAMRLCSNFNYSIAKKRLIMMTKTSSKKRVLCKSMVLIPVFTAAICIFSSKTIAQTEMNPETNGSDTVKTVVFDPTEIIPIGKGVSEELTAEYEEIVNKYLDMVSFVREKKDKAGFVIKEYKIKWKTMSLSDEDLDYLYVLYIQMNKEQRQKQYINFNSALTSFMFRGPNKDEWKSCKNADIVWLNGERMDKSALNSYVRSNFKFFMTHRVNNGNERVAALWTQKGYEEYIKQHEEQISVSELLEIKPQIWFSTTRHVKK